MARKALITGITGQDGSYLADYLLSLGYEVHGLVRRVALEAPETRFKRIAHILDRVTLHPASLESYASIFHVFSSHDFEECYHLAAQSFVAESFDVGGHVDGEYVGGRIPRLRFGLVYGDVARGWRWW